MKYVPPYGASSPTQSYQDGNPAIGLKGSRVPAAAIQNPQLEIVQAISDAGLIPTDGDLTQLSQAITKRMNTVNAYYRSVAVGGTANALTVTTVPVITAYADGQLAEITPVLTSTSSTVTVNMSGVGTVGLVYPDGLLPAAGSIMAGCKFLAAYDATLVKWVILSRLGLAGTTKFTTLTSGVGATFTVTPGCRAMKVVSVGGGAGGGGVKYGTGYYMGSDGGDTSFGGVIAKGGKAALIRQTGGLGGTGGTGTIAGATIIRTAGAQGGPGANVGGGNIPGGYGASSRYGGAGTAGAAGGGGVSALANTGSGGGGAGGYAPSTADPSPAGGAGEDVTIYITSPATSYLYTIGAGGPGATTAVDLIGGNGGSGRIDVEEYF